MTRCSPPSSSLNVELRVRYAECDPQNVAHHSAYPVWFELARTELLRAQGAVYRDLETRGICFVVARLSVRYKMPARYDDLLQINVRTLPSRGVKVDHAYAVRRDQVLLATAETTLVCVDRDGVLRPVPEEILTTGGHGPCLPSPDHGHGKTLPEK